MMPLDIFEFTILIHLEISNNVRGTYKFKNVYEDEWIKRRWYIHTMKYDSAFKKEILSL